MCFTCWVYFSGNFGWGGTDLAVAVCLCLLTLLSGVFGVVGTAVLLLAIVVVSVGVLLAWFSVVCECLFNSVGFLDSLIVLLSLFVVLGGWQFCACMVRLCLVVLGWIILVGFVGCLGDSVLWWFVWVVGVALVCVWFELCCV